MPWTGVDGPEPTREVTYVLAMNNPLLKVKEADVRETTHILKKTDWLLYSVELRTFTPQLPFGDCFNPVMRLCISWVTKESCRLVITIGINFSKSTMMKSVIKSNGIKGLGDTCRDIVEILQADIDASSKDSNAYGDTAAAAAAAAGESTAVVAGSSETRASKRVSMSSSSRASKAAVGGSDMVVNRYIVYVVAVLAAMMIMSHLYAFVWPKKQLDCQMSSPTMSSVGGKWHGSQPSQQEWTLSDAQQLTMIDWSSELQSPRSKQISQM
eukprot:jgi/Hompol1/3130/HPOL_006377-RA